VTASISADLIVDNCAQVVTCDPARDGGGAGVIRGAALAARGDRLVWIGPAARLAAEVAPTPDCRWVDGRGRIALPGFVDSHTHLVFAGSREQEYAMRARGASYQEIAAAGGGIRATVRATRAATIEQLVRLAMPRLDAMLAHGTTTCEAKSGYGLTLEDELKMLEAIGRLDAAHAVDVRANFCGAHEVPDEFRGRTDEYVELVVKTMLPEVARRGLARYVDVFCEEGVFSIEQSRRILRAGAEHGLAAKFHADEFVTLGGAALAAEVKALSADHLLRASLDDVRRMNAAGVTATLLPGTAFFLGLPYAPARQFLETGARVALASDFNPGSSPGLNMQLVMTMALSQMRMTPEEALLGATLHGAWALGLEREIGSLAPGKLCDVILYDVADWTQIAYFYGVNHVSQVIKRGRAAWPELDLMTTYS
jgi:imidazolonepropionase